MKLWEPGVQVSSQALWKATCYFDNEDSELGSGAMLNNVSAGSSTSKLCVIIKMNSKKLF